VRKKKKKARVLIGFCLQDLLIPNVIYASTSKESWDFLLNLYETKGLVKQTIFETSIFFPYK
jgi:hypothetical protein